MQRTQRLLGTQNVGPLFDPALGQSAAYAHGCPAASPCRPALTAPWLVFSVGTLLVLSALGLFQLGFSELVRPVLVEQISARTVFNTAQAD